MLNDKVILVTGGTGSFGRAFTELALTRYKPKKLIIFSRDEFKQYEMAKRFPASDYPIRYFLGDIRDRERLRRAFDDADYVVHAAALKQVPALEYNPTEAVRTNVDGAENIIGAAIDARVEKVVAISTDKAVNPVNLYGATKLVAEKTFIAANSYAGRKVCFSVVRYGNVVGSRGSIIPVLLGLRKQGATVFPITDERMTRFLITLESAVDLVLRSFTDAQGGEIYVPKIASTKITDLARAIEPGCRFQFVGIRPGEKLYETLISDDESRNTKDLKDIFAILPQFYEGRKVAEHYARFPDVPAGFSYRSDTNDQWLDGPALRKLIAPIEAAYDAQFQPQSAQ